MGDMETLYQQLRDEIRRAGHPWNNRREIGRVSMTGADIDAKRRDCVISVIERPITAPPAPALSDAERRARATEAGRKARADAAEKRKLDYLTASPPQRPCKFCGETAGHEHVVAANGITLTACPNIPKDAVILAPESGKPVVLAEPAVRSGIDPTDRVMPLDPPRFLDSFDHFVKAQREGTGLLMAPEAKQNASALWSAMLRRRVDAAAEKERHRVVVDLDWE